MDCAPQATLDYCTMLIGGSASLPLDVTFAPQPSVTLPPYMQGMELTPLDEVGDNLPLPLGLCQGT